jgi:hypothetical protein
VKDHKQEAGDNAHQYQAGGALEVHNHGLTVEQLDELKHYVDGQVVGEVERFVTGQMEVFREEFAKFQGQAYDQALLLAQGLLTKFVEQLAAKAPQNLPSIQTVPMQHAILNAQTSAAIVDDDELTDTLVDILVDKSGTEPRSFKGVVLTEALGVVSKLTADQVNLLTALVMITRTLSHGWDTDEIVFRQLDEQCRPLYGKIPTNNSALQYMSYTGVGYIETTSSMLIGRVSVADTIIRTYSGVFTTGFDLDQVPDELKAQTGLVIPVDARYGVGDGKHRFKIASNQTLEKMINPGDATAPLWTNKEEMLKLIADTLLPTEKFKEIVESDKPDLAQFIRDLDRISAATFLLSTVGIAIGQANWRRIQAESAPAVDIYLSD